MTLKEYMATAVVVVSAIGTIAVVVTLVGSFIVDTFIMPRWIKAEARRQVERKQLDHLYQLSGRGGNCDQKNR